MTFAVLSLLFLRIGADPYGTSLEDDPTCLVPEALPAGIHPVDSARVPATAERTWLPLGLVCSIDLAGNGGVAVVRHQSPLATVLWLVCSAGAVVALALAVRSARQVLITLRSGDLG